MKISRQTREIINIVVFLVVVGLLLTFYVIYPLNRTKALMGREGVDDFATDSIPPIDPTLFVEAGLAVDTFRVEADGLTQLGCFYLTPPVDSAAPTDSARGTVIIVPSPFDSLAAALPLAQQLLDSGFIVTLYDQRATGSSTGRYLGEGQYESADLQALIAYMFIHQQVQGPLDIVGFATGGDAALLLEEEETRLNRVVAVEPFLTTTRWLDFLRDKHESIGIPFFRTVMWFWYEIRSGYAAEYRDPEEVRGVTYPTLVLLPEEALESEAAEQLRADSETGQLELTACPTNPAQTAERIVAFLTLTEPTEN